MIEILTHQTSICLALCEQRTAENQQTPAVAIIWQLCEKGYWRCHCRHIAEVESIVRRWSLRLTTWKRLRRALVCVSFYFGIFGDRQCDRLTMCRTIQASRFQMQLLSFTSRVCIHLTQTLATPLVFLFFFSILSFSMHRCRPEHHTRDERVW